MAQRIRRAFQLLASGEALGLLFPGRRGSLRALALGALAIALWQASLIPARHHLDPAWKLRASSGMWVRDWDRFFYFEFYRGLYPVMSTAAELENSAQGAARALSQGETLQTEFFYLTRYGGHGRILPLWVDGLLRGRPLEASLKPFNLLFFEAALLSFLVACWNLGAVRFGLVGAALLGSDPFQLASVFEENVFSYPISLALLLLALHLHLIVRGCAPAATAAIAVLSGILLASFGQIRSENLFLAASPALVYLTLPRAGLARRALLVAALLGALAATSALWERHWQRKIAIAEQTVQAAGGVVYSGPRSRGHPIWHSLFCGLGDYASELGYRWSDTGAYAYAVPMLRERYRPDLELNPAEPYFTNLTYPDGRFLVKWESLPEYDLVLREKILRDVREHPAVFAKLVVRRLLRLFTDTTPVGVNLFGSSLAVPFVGLASLPVVLALVRGRSRGLLVLIGFSAPLGLTALLIYSGYGTTWYSIYHVLCASLFISLLLLPSPSATAPAPPPPPADTGPR